MGIKRHPTRAAAPVPYGLAGEGGWRVRRPLAEAVKSQMSESEEPQPQGAGVTTVGYGDVTPHRVGGRSI